MDDGKPDKPDPELDALLASLGGDPEKMLAELMGGEAEPGDPVATKPREIRARLKEIASKNPQLVAKIIEYWIKEGKRWK